MGGFVISNAMAQSLDTLMSGGIGSLSEYEEQPSYMPDKFEAGTMNLPGIFGLHTALKYIDVTGIDSIREKELELTEMLLEGLSVLKGIHITGLRSTEGRTAVISVDFRGYDNAVIAHSLDKYHGIKTRCGLHCAPSAHKTLGTFPHGTVRFSPGHFNTKEEIEYTISSINHILKQL